jgi:uncharacterized protein (DUF952 family)
MDGEAMYLYHITRRKDWEISEGAGVYTGDTLDREGFIHCSAGEQVLRVANAFYHNQAGLVLLEIDPGQLIPEVKWEPAPGGELFPHLYGPLNLEAVRRVLDFSPGHDGLFQFPTPEG